MSINSQFLIPSNLDLTREGEQVVYPGDFRHNKANVPYVLLTFANDAITLQSSLDSLPEFLEHGVLLYSDPLPGCKEDASLEIARAFVAKRSGFKLVKYPLPVIPAGNKWLAEHLFDGGITAHWLESNLLNFGLVQLEELIAANNHQDSAWLWLLNVTTIYSKATLTALQEQILAQQCISDCWTLHSVPVVVDLYQLNNKAGGLGKLLSKMKLSTKETLYSPELLQGARLALMPTTLTTPTLITDYVVRYRQVKDFIYHYLKPRMAAVVSNSTANGEAVAAASTLTADDLALVQHYPHLRYQAETIQAPEKWLVGFNLSQEKVAAYTGFTTKQLKDYYQQVAEHVISDLAQLPVPFVSDKENYKTTYGELFAVSLVHDPEFWQPQESYSWLATLAYPQCDNLLTHPVQEYSLDLADYQTLVHDQKYRFEGWLKGYNIKVNQPIDDALVKAFYLGQSRMYNTYFNNRVTTVEQLYMPENK